MAHAPVQGTDESPEVAAHRRGWEFFLKASKWFALHVLGLVFFLIFWRVGGAPLVPTFVLMAAAVYILGSIFH
jgi:hypothetical protein